MSDYGDTMRMPPLARADIDRLAHAFLVELAPSALSEPCPLDVARLVDFEVQIFGIHFSPADLPDSEAYTDPTGTGEINILMSEEQYDSLVLPGRAANRGRATACHEIGHALLHVPVIRRRRGRTEILSANSLQRVARRDIPAYECAEWQAWEFASHILMPTATLRTLDDLSASRVAAIYGVSEMLAEIRIKKARLR